MKRRESSSSEGKGGEKNSRKKNFQRFSERVDPRSRNGKPKKKGVQFTHTRENGRIMAVSIGQRGRRRAEEKGGKKASVT